MNRFLSFDQPFRTLFRDGNSIVILDQTRLPYEKRYVRLSNVAEAARAIRIMQVRGAPLIGAVAAYGVALAMNENTQDAALDAALHMLMQTRPTAVNLQWALRRMEKRLRPLFETQRAQAAWQEAERIGEEDRQACEGIGRNGLSLLREIETEKGRVCVMTHCNAGWLATLGMGTALAPVYAAYEAGLEVSVVVSETRPRNQGLLTAWELGKTGVPYTLIADNTAAWMLASGCVDAVVVGADRIAANGDTANKVGTCLKALAAHAHGIPFYVAAPFSTVDPDCPSGAFIHIEDRDGEEVRSVTGLDGHGNAVRVCVAAKGIQVVNPAFDITPASLITGFVTEAGVFEPGVLLDAARNRSA